MHGPNDHFQEGGVPSIGPMYYFMRGPQRIGPAPRDQLLALGLTRDAPVWFEGAGDWMRADQVPSLRDVIARLPVGYPTLPELSYPPGPSYSTRHFTPGIRPSTFHVLYYWYLGLLSSAVFISLVGIACLVIYNASRTRNHAWEVAGGLSLLGGGGLLLAAQGLFLMLLYQCWSVIQDGSAQATPGTAVGFLFIPVFHIYWMFVAIAGLANDLNQYVRRYNIESRFVPAGLPLAGCIVAVFPHLNLLISLLVLWPLSMHFFRSTAAAIAEAQAQR